MGPSAPPPSAKAPPSPRRLPWLGLWLSLMAAMGTTTVAKEAHAKTPRLSNLYLNPGLTVGGSASLGDPSGSGWTLGLELSTVFFQKHPQSIRNAKEAFYFGVYADGLYDSHREGPRLSVGPERGLTFLGLGGGHLVELRHHRAYHGAVVRFFASLGVLGVFVRYGALFGARDFVEAGLLIKVPLGRFRKRRGRRGARDSTLCFLEGSLC